MYDHLNQEREQREMERESTEYRYSRAVGDEYMSHFVIDHIRDATEMIGDEE